ncbi:MAG TPA: hypothetical protein DEQ23_07965 [Chlorobium sp.]|uniref:AAA family ATPase n=1 Tax=Chlorobium phaeovibrioides (strain DSM 265 / 1930) TaxID=290318 RepID=A4SEX7_CHLPM|nr:hypothetical protein [Chlorobium sp.]
MDQLPEALRKPSAYSHLTGPVEVAETHISWVFLAGEYAYKVKKPVNLGFLDFSTLEQRKFYCHEELRLNRRLCRELYLAVLPIVRKEEGLFIGGSGETVDYCVQMQRFDRTRELDRLLADGELTNQHIDRLAEEIGAFHGGLEPLPMGSEYGTPENLIKPILRNFSHSASSDPGDAECIAQLKKWTIDEHAGLKERLAERKRMGFIRECHGDMHTGNMVERAGKILIFDCIEFSRELSCIDIVSDILFLFMDLLHSGAPGLGWRLLNRWLSITGDYASLPLLRFYTLYRAMVRAKVTAIRSTQATLPADKQRALEEHRSYLRFAETLTKESQPMLIITEGLSGSGKTTHAAALSEMIGAVSVRSDIERKRLAGLRPLQRSSRETEPSIYTEAKTGETYSALLAIALTTLQANLPIIVDATFLRQSDRQKFMDLAESVGCGFMIMSFHAPLELLKERVEKREQEASDASEAGIGVLEAQYHNREALSASEERVAIHINTSEPVDYNELAGRITPLFQTPS